MQSYNFIIVGSGPSGSLLAAKLASTARAPSVLLLEAGSGPSVDDAMQGSTRFLDWVVRPGLNWGYKTVPQTHLAGRELDYSRGKGLGGSSLINFAMYNTPPDGDFDEWSACVGDPAFGAKAARELLKTIERYGEVDDECKDLVSWDERKHGRDGPVGVEFHPRIDGGVRTLVAAMGDFGVPLNLDINSGNPLGVGILPAYTEHDGKDRTTAASAYMNKGPANLSIMGSKQVVKVLVQGKKAVGVEVLGGEKFFANKSVILSCGAIDTPKLLLLSGIGPREHLAATGIPIVHHLPGVGCNLADHVMLSFEYETTPELAALRLNDPFTTPVGDLDIVNLPAGFLSLPSADSPPAFQPLPLLPTVPSSTLSSRSGYDRARHLARTGVPSLEFAVDVNFPPGVPSRPAPTLAFKTFNLAPRSRGTVRLSGADPLAAPLVDPCFLSDPRDARDALAAARWALGALASSGLARHVVRPLVAPDAGDDDKALPGWVRESAASAWHPCGTVGMGSDEEGPGEGEGGEEEEGRLDCVDTRFRVRGVQNLRVVDLSVAPFPPTAHPASLAYLIGAWAAQRIVEDFGLAEQHAVEGEKQEAASNSFIVLN